MSSCSRVEDALLKGEVCSKMKSVMDGSEQIDRDGWF